MTTYYYRSNRTHNNDNVLQTTAVMIVLSIIFCLAFIYAFDKSIDNQDTMLCNSAKVSGNLEYLTKCQCFYDTQDIECIQK